MLPSKILYACCRMLLHRFNATHILLTALRLCFRPAWQLLQQACIMSFLKKLFQGRSSCEEATEQANAEASPHSPKPPGTCVGDSASLPEGGRLHAKIEASVVITATHTCQWHPPHLQRPSHPSPHLCTLPHTIAMQGRYITVLRLDGVLRCIDSICFHAGGPLVRMVPGHSASSACVMCP